MPDNITIRTDSTEPGTNEGTLTQGTGGSIGQLTVSQGVYNRIVAVYYNGTKIRGSRVQNTTPASGILNLIGFTVDPAAEIEVRYTHL